ncbi:MAG: glycogen-binding domain-containing protein [Deltaproteobacteria bacterium]|nr:glycogen-binding domain-containing protein [Deltaproteobacteria bacterium]
MKRLLDRELGAREALELVAALPEGERKEVLAYLRLSSLASALPAVEPSEGFEERVRARIRARPAPRRGLWTWLRTPRLSPLGALGAVAAAVALVLVPGLRERPQPPQDRLVARLALRAPEARRVSVAGDFNGWSTEATPLRRGPGGAWTVELPLGPGRHQYQFVVDGTFVPDPAAPTVDDGFGGRNAILDL